MRLIIALGLWWLASGTIKAQPIHILSAAEANQLLNHESVKLNEGVYCLPVDFTLTVTSENYSLEGIPGKTTITSYNPADPKTDFQVKLLDTNQPDLFEDGTYVVANNPYYSFGGGFAHLDLPYKTAGEKISYTQGTILVKKNGLWKRHYTGSGFHVRGSLRVRNLRFENCQFYLFSPFGKTISDEFSISHCRFNNVARVLSSSLYGGMAEENWFNSLLLYPVDGSYRFKKMVIDQNEFSQIHTSIIWGCPPVGNVRITGNVIKDCPSTIAFFNLYQKDYADEDYFANRNRELIANNVFENIVQGVNRWTVSLTRTSGRAVVRDNKYNNCNVQVLLLYGGNSTFCRNQVTSTLYSNKQPMPLILVKNIDHPTHKISGNNIIAPASLLISVEGRSNISITKNNLEVGTVYSKNNPIFDPGQWVDIENNTIKAETLVHISDRDTVQFGQVKIKRNEILQLNNLHTGKSHIGSMSIRKNRLYKKGVKNFPLEGNKVELQK